MLLYKRQKNQYRILPILRRLPVAIAVSTFKMYPESRATIAVATILVRNFTSEPNKLCVNNRNTAVSVKWTEYLLPISPMYIKPLSIARNPFSRSIFEFRRKNMVIKPKLKSGLNLRYVSQLYINMILPYLKLLVWLHILYLDI